MGTQDTESDDPSDSPWWDVSISDLRDWHLLVKVSLVVAAIGVLLWLLGEVVFGVGEGFCSELDSDPPQSCWVDIESEL